MIYLQSGMTSTASIVAALVGQDIVANSLKVTGTNVSSIYVQNPDTSGSNFAIQLGANNGFFFSSSGTILALEVGGTAIQHWTSASSDINGSFSANGNVISSNGGFSARNDNFIIGLGTAGTANFYNDSPGSHNFNFAYASLAFISTNITLDGTCTFASAASISTAGALTSTNNNSTSLILGSGNAVTQNGHVLWSGAAPTIASGFGTSPSVVASNGTMAFQIDVGTGGVAASGVITLPAATTGWILMCNDITDTDQFTKQTASTTTTATIGSFNSDGSTASWRAHAKINIIAVAY